MFEILQDDLASDQTRGLLALHLAEAHANSPPGSVFALDLSGLQVPGITVWTVWRDSGIVGVGAMKRLADGSGELKSVRTHPDHLRQGVAAALLDFIVAEARVLGLTRLSLETGSGAAYGPALAFYRRYGFIDGEAFSEYRKSDFNHFLHLPLRADAEAAAPPPIA